MQDDHLQQNQQELMLSDIMAVDASTTTISLTSFDCAALSVPGGHHSVLDLGCCETFSMSHGFICCKC